MQTRTLVYADLGPLSCEKRKPFTPASILDDDRIEYAQLNTRISARSLREVQQTAEHPESFTGTCARNLISELHMYFKMQP